MDEKKQKYLQQLKSNYHNETLIRQLKVKKQNYQNTLDRAAVLNPDSEFDPNDTKIGKIIRDLDKKILKLKKKKINDFETEEFDLELSEKVKSEAQLEHSLKLVEIMFHEQAKTEEFLHEALTQLKNLYLSSYESTNDEVKQNFKVKILEDDFVDDCRFHRSLTISSIIADSIDYFLFHRLLIINFIKYCRFRLWLSISSILVDLIDYFRFHR